MRITDILLTAANAVAPIILLILLGYYLKRFRIITGDFVKTGKYLVFHIFLPCMLFVNVYNIESVAAIRWDVVLYCVAALVVIFLLALLTVGHMTDAPKRRGVLLQCAFRSNYALIGLSLAGALGGEEATAVAAVVSAFTIPLFNILSVAALSMFVENAASWKNRVKKVFRNIVTNPLMIGIALGFVCLLLREAQVAVLGSPVFTLRTHTKFLYTALNHLKAVASPFSMIVLGGEFELSAIKGMKKEIFAGTVWRLVITPLLGLGGAILISRTTDLLVCDVNVFPALIALFGSPVAVSSAIMAGSMGNDEQLATQLVVWTSLLSIFTVFLQVCLLMGLGLLAV